MVFNSDGYYHFLVINELGPYYHFLVFNVDAYYHFLVFKDALPEACLRWWVMHLSTR